MGRIAVGEADADDEAELEALRSFKLSLQPPPRRGWTIAGLVAAIVVSQVLLDWLLRQEGADSKLGRAFSEISLSPDTKSIGGLGRALTSADLIELSFFIFSFLFVVYVFDRPLASGYRLAQLCLGRRALMSSRRRNSALCRQAALHGIPQKEMEAASIARARLRSDAPIDQLVKAAPWMALFLYLIVVVRSENSSLPALPAAAAAGTSAALLAAIVLLPRRRVRRLRTGRWRAVHSVLSVGMVVGVFVLILMPTLFPGGGEADEGLLVGLAVAVLVLRLVRFGRHVPRGQRTFALGAPVAVIIGIGFIAQYDPFILPSHADAAREAISVGDVPRLARTDLQILLASHQDLSGADLRTQNLSELSLRGKRLQGAQFTLANLRNADLRRADLRKADLRGVSAVDARLGNANLVGANLGCADLRGADLRGADLRKTNLFGVAHDELTRWPKRDRPKSNAEGTETVADSLKSLAASTIEFHEYLNTCLWEDPFYRPAR